MTDFQSAAALLAATEITPAEWRDLSEVLELCGDMRGLLEPQIPTPCRESKLHGWLQQNLDARRLDVWVRRLQALHGGTPDLDFVTVTDAAYPENLKASYDRPPFLFVRGRFQPADANALAIVGSRDTTEQALYAATSIAQIAAKHGITVVSGLARGVDEAAHEAAVAAGGRTIAVLGSGIDTDKRLEPPTGLACDILAAGAIVSQFRPGSPGTRSSFPIRNAVISGLSLASLLVDAQERSGTRSEAEHSLKQGRPVLLWGPTLGARPWAQKFARQPGVSFVHSSDDIFDFLDARRASGA